MAKFFGGGNRRDYEHLIKLCEQQGWRIVRGKKGVKCFPPDKSLGCSTVHLSAFELRSYRNTVAELRRKGLKVDR